MPRFALVALFITLSSQATATDSLVRQALIDHSSVGSSPQVAFATSPKNALVFGAVLGSESGQILVLRKDSTGRYEVEATTGQFQNEFGHRYYIEIVQYHGNERFSIQVNSHSGCGIRVERFRFFGVSGKWRVAGYDKSDPDEQTCDVNFRSREYTANLLTRQVATTAYVQGKAVQVRQRRSRVAAPSIEGFSFSIFQDEP